MSSYFTISGSYYPAESGTVVVFDKGLSSSYTPLVRQISYGDGYVSRVPVAPPLRTFSASFSNRSLSDIQVIETYIKNLQGSLIPNLVINSETGINARFVSYSKTYVNGEISSISVQLEEEFR